MFNFREKIKSLSSNLEILKEQRLISGVVIAVVFLLLFLFSLLFSSKSCVRAIEKQEGQIIKMTSPTTGKDAEIIWNMKLEDDLYLAKSKEEEDKKALEAKISSNKQSLENSLEGEISILRGAVKDLIEKHESQITLLDQKIKQLAQY